MSTKSCWRKWKNVLSHYLCDYLLLSFDNFDSSSSGNKFSLQWSKCQKMLSNYISCCLIGSRVILVFVIMTHSTETVNKNQSVNVLIWLLLSFWCWQKVITLSGGHWIYIVFCLKVKHFLKIFFVDEPPRLLNENRISNVEFKSFRMYCSFCWFWPFLR